MRLLVSLLLAAHAIAHLPNCLVAWNFLAGPDLPHRTALLGGRVRVGERGIRLFGVLWLIAAVLVAIAAIHMFRNTPEAWSFTRAAVAFSGLLTILGWPDSRTGVV